MQCFKERLVKNMEHLFMSLKNAVFLTAAIYTGGMFIKEGDLLWIVTSFLWSMSALFNYKTYNE